MGNIPPEGVGAPGPDENEAMVDAPLENLLRKIVKQTGKTAAPVVVTPRTLKIKKEAATPGPSGVKIKKEPPTPKPPLPPKPSTLETPKKSGGFKKAALSGAAKGFLKFIGVNPKFIYDDETRTKVKVPKAERANNLKRSKRQKQKNWPKVGKSGTSLPRES